METPLLNLKRQYQQLRPELEKALAAVFESQRFIRGPELKELESAVADYHGIAHAVGVASGTDALLLLLEALDLKPGDEVITTPFTFVATAETILRAGATPVFVDIDPATFNLDPNRLEAARTEKTRGVVPVHLFGLAADLDPILAWAEKHRLWVMEDCAQAFGAAYRGRKVGTFGVGGAFSFFPSKNLGGFGDGGLVTTADSRRAETVRILSEHGGRDKYNVVMLGHNSRLDTLQAAV
ncbi:MAG TPA: DegT/DnrJ/EryC1/StrS family aminotransferase, partial [bacterium]|nr:DegT/DnrJ/EryC1/StrS family aminotransferase [bacterium]